MTDRELLELAAKAAEIERGEDRLDCAISITENGRHRSLPQWNPLTDDGDALRLAVQLKMSMLLDSRGFRGSMTWVRADQTEKTQHHDGDPYAATRRAIVRAAAEIGRGME
jgi:hypothetical protein